MSLESAEWRDRGVPSPRQRPPTMGDRLARAAALLILIGVFAFSAFAVSLVPFAIYLVVGLLVVGLVYLLFRVRELSRRLDEQRAALEAMRPAPQPPAEEGREESRAPSP